MTLAEIKASPAVWLTAADIAPVLECNPNSIRAQAQTDPSKLGFKVSVIGNRVLIPRISFLDFFGE